MAHITTQKELVLEWKKETFLNVEILSKLHPMSGELSRFIFKENILEKPTQNFLNHLCYYLVSIIDKQISASFSWPLYDSKTEKLFRNELAKFINEYSSKGLLSPVLSSYLVNPSSYKVQKLFYQMSQLAVQRLLMTCMKKESQKKLYKDMSEKYKSGEKEGFIVEIEQCTELMLSRFSIYLSKRKTMVQIAEVLCKKISEMEEKLMATNAIEYINNIVDNYVKTNDLDELTKANIISVKDVNKPAKIFDDWLLYTDKAIDEMEESWAVKMDPFVGLAQSAYDNTKTLISRYTGEMDKNLYMIEYNPNQDENTLDLQNQVNSEQKYILKNIIKDGRLNFPNLIRGFLIAISFILKNAEMDDDIYRFNECLDSSSMQYEDMVSTLRGLVTRIMNGQADLQAKSESSAIFISPACNLLKPVFEIPDLPDLSDIRSNRHLQYPISFDSFTPLNTTKHQFNLLRRSNLALSKPRSKSLFAGTFYQPPQNMFMRNLATSSVNSHDHLNMTQNFHNLSVVPQFKANETIANCGTGFTKEQITRLLSTKKKSSTKKQKYCTKKPDFRVVKAGLFEELSISNENNILLRSHSSPNLFEYKERRHVSSFEKRRLSIMKEDMLDVSGIVALDNKSDTPQGIAESSREIDGVKIPTFTLTPCREAKIKNVLEAMGKELQVDKEFEIKEHIKADNMEKTNTPKNNPQLIQKTNSLEKIINRFKKVRASVLPGSNNIQEANEFKAIVEEKENLNADNVDGLKKKFLLPDLLSPSCSLDQIVMDFDEIGERKKTRQSLGAALGVDDTFLDQYDFID